MQPTGALPGNRLRGSTVNHFDHIRLFLAVLVIWSHSFPLATGNEAQELISRLTHGQMTGGAIAVDLFFVISGYLITASALRSKSSWAYLSKRVRRIYPGFVAAMAVCLLVVLPLSGGFTRASGWMGTLVDFVTKTIRLQEFSYRDAFASNPYPGSINGAVWSIPYEFWCYIGVLLLSLSGLLHRRRWVMGGFVFSVAISLAFAVTGWKPGGSYLGLIFGYPPLWARLLPYYLAGVVFYLEQPRIPQRGSWCVVSVAALAVACVVPHGWALCFPVFGTYLTFWLALRPADSTWNVVRWGDLSYGTYLYAFPIQQLLVRATHGRLGPWALFALATPLSLSAALLSWHLVEKHWLTSRSQPAQQPQGLPVTNAVNAEA